MLVSDADHFRWRDGGFGDLIPLLGDGMLTIDGDFHRQSRRTMLPAFHHERVLAARGVMDEEIERALAPWHDGLELDLYAWARELALRVAMRALFGFDPEPVATACTRRASSSARSAFYGREYWLQVLRGPGTPWRAQANARGRLDRLIYAEIAQRRRTGARGDDVLSLLLDAPFSDRHVRDHVMTLLFAGHDTTTATIAFFFYELARHPEIAAAIAGDDGPARPGARGDAAALPAGVDRPAPRGRGVRVRRPPRSPPARRSTTPRGPRTGCPTSGRRRTSSAPSASRPSSAAASRRAPTSRSAADRGSASGCASGSSRSRRSPPP